jgi:hypothetical protein
MKKKRLSLLKCLIAMLLPVAGFSQVTQTEMTFKPDACRGKDTWVENINGVPSYATRNFGSYDQIAAAAWTFSGLGGQDGYLRALIDFADLQSIPQGTTVSYAYLSLYGVPTSGLIGSGSYGSNACYVQRVTSAWDESTVTWNTQPSITTTNQVTLPGSNGVQWNYHVIDLNITTLLQDIINLPPAQRYGLSIRLQSEVYYRSMLFASSDHADASRHPKLRIGLNYCSAAAARQTTNPAIAPADKLDENGKSANGLKAIVKTNLSANQVSVAYDLAHDGKTVLEIVSSDGALLKSVQIDGAKGRHTKTITLDAPLLKNKMAILVIKQGNNKIASPFVIGQ